MPFVSPLTVQVNGPLDHEQVFPSGDEVTTYEEIAAPPFDTGATHDTAAAPFAAPAVTERGTPGGPLGMTGELATDATLSPMALVAFTVNV